MTMQWGWAIVLLTAGAVGVAWAEPAATPAAAVAREADDARLTQTVAMWPLMNRAGKPYEHLSAVIALETGRAIREGGKAMMVNRDRVDALIDERRLAELGLVEAWQHFTSQPMIAADAVVFGQYNLIEGDLVITADVVVVDEQVEQWLTAGMPDGYQRVRVAGPATTPLATARQFGQTLADLFAEADRIAPAEPPKAADAAGVALFDLVTPPGDPHTAVAALRLADALGRAYHEQTDGDVVDRADIQAVLNELELELAELTAPERSLAVGRLIGAERILVGAVMPAEAMAGDSAFAVHLHLLDTACGTLLAHATTTAAAGDEASAAEALLATLLPAVPPALEQLAVLKASQPADHSEAVILAHRGHMLTLHGRQPEAERYAQADRLTEAALTIGPNLGYVHLYRSHVVAMLDRLDEARVHAERAVELDPDDAWLHAMLGRVRSRFFKEHAEALPHFQHALELAEPGSLAQARTHVLMGHAYRDLELDTEAIEQYRTAADLLIWHSDRITGLYELARIYARQGRLEQAIETYIEAGQIADGLPGKNPEFYFRRARRLYEQLDDEAGAMRMLQHELERNHKGKFADWRILAEYLVDREPERAAQIAYRRRVHTTRASTMAQWHALIEATGHPNRRPLFSGSVFDLDALREQNVMLHLQVYEGFKHPSITAYLKRHLEDVVGIPIHLDDQPRPLPDASYQRSLDRVHPGSDLFDDLHALRRASTSLIAVGLISNDLNEWVSIRDQHHRVGMVTSEYFDRITVNANTPEPLHTARAYRYLAAQTMKMPVMLVANDGPEGREGTHCFTQSCIARRFTRVGEAEATPCLDCRHRMRQTRPDWPAGPDARPPLIAGPVQPAVSDPAGYVLLLGLGLDERRSELPDVGRAITLSTGLPVKVVLADEPADPEAYTERGTILQAFVAAAAQAAAAKQAETPLVVCAVSGRTLASAWPRWLAWHKGEPADASEAGNAPLVLMVGLGHDRWAYNALVEQLQTRETVVPPDGGEPFEAPQYAKYFVAGLVAAARQDQACWDYGCPATLWEHLGEPQRCSYWLSETCAAALRGAFGRR